MSKRIIGMLIWGFSIVGMVELLGLGYVAMLAINPALERKDCEDIFAIAGDLHQNSLSS